MSINAIKNFDPAHEAFKILCEHNNAMVSGIHAEYDNAQDMLDCTTEECAFILTTNLVEGKYTPMQFAAVRNALGELLWKVFGPAIEAEEKAKMEAEANAMNAVIAEIRMYMQ